MNETCTVTMKLTDAEIDKIIWSMKSIKTVLGVFEIVPDDNWIITLDKLLKSMEQISAKVKEAKDEERTKEEKRTDPKKEYINKITG